MSENVTKANDELKKEDTGRAMADMSALNEKLKEEIEKYRQEISVLRESNFSLQDTIIRLAMKLTK